MRKWIAAIGVFALLAMAAGIYAADETKPASQTSEVKEQESEVKSTEAKTETEAGAPVAEPKELKPGVYVLFDTTMGKMVAKLFDKEAPNTVANFVGLAEGTKEFTDPKTGQRVKRPFYDGLLFHRVIPNFMIQGGCPLGTGMGDPGYKFEDEMDAEALGLSDIKVKDARWSQFYLRNSRIPQAAAMEMTVKEFYEKSGFKYVKGLESKKPLAGTLAMANSGPNTNGSQFFINEVETPHLTGRHTVFGILIHGADIEKKIARVPTSSTDPGDPKATRPKVDVVMNKVRIVRVAEGEKVGIEDILSGKVVKEPQAPKPVVEESGEVKGATK